MTTRLCIGLTIAAVFALSPIAGVANERPGPSGSVGGGAGPGGGVLGKGGVPQGQAPVDPKQPEVNTPPTAGSGKTTQNPKPGSESKGGGSMPSDKVDPKHK
ncbi:MAG: hypothetical protein K0S45_2172 [Nitrospira sp.]|jgi:hypothetical protein|nr:hypothetical protein [Nitrospira sp.]